MSEEEIIKEIESLSPSEEAIQDMLILYYNEKDKNKELQDKCIELATTIDALTTDYKEEKEKNKEYFKTLCNYEDTLGYYEDTLENLIDKYSELCNIYVADAHTIYLRELITDLEKLFKKILNCECKKEIINLKKGVKNNETTNNK